MAKIIGAAVLVLGFAVAAQAGGSPHFIASPTTYSESGAGGAGGGGTGGSGSLMHIPPARFAVRCASGSATDYIPSTFVSYDSAVAEGKASIAARPQPLGTSAREGGRQPTKTVPLKIVQTQGGGLAIQR